MIIFDEIQRPIRRTSNTVILPFRRTNWRRDHASVPMHCIDAAPLPWALESDPSQPNLFDAADIDDGRGAVNSRE